MYLKKIFKLLDRLLSRWLLWKCGLMSNYYNFQFKVDLSYMMLTT